MAEETTAVETHDDAPEAPPGDYAEELAKVRRESKNLRDRLRASEARIEELAAAEARCDQLSRALFTAHVAATGKVENAAEIAYNADILDDTDALNEAVDAAIAERPYIKTHVFGAVGQGERGENAGPQDFSTFFQ